MDYKIYLIATVIVLVAFAVLLYTQFTRIDKRMAIIEEELHEHSLMLNSKGDRSAASASLSQSAAPQEIHQTQEEQASEAGDDGEAGDEGEQAGDEGEAGSHRMMDFSSLFGGGFAGGMGLDAITRMLSTPDYQGDADDEAEEDHTEGQIEEEIHDNGLVLGETIDADEDAISESSEHIQEDIDFKIEDTSVVVEPISVTLTTDISSDSPVIIEQTIDADEIQEEEPQIIYENLTLAQLKNLCEERGIRFTAKTKRVELIDKLRNAQEDENSASRTIDIQL